jgi:glycosyltransferase involved in cell wall biosynthesis
MVSPWPPTRSGIADYSSELLGALVDHVDVTRYEPGDADRAFSGHHAVVLLQIGNDPLHLPSVEALARHGKDVPSVVVLHDYALHHLFAAAYLDQGKDAAYVREMARAHGIPGLDFAARSVAGPRIPIWDLDPWAFPMSRGVVGDATAVIVHSRLVRGAVLWDRPGARVVEIPHHVVPASRTPRQEARALLGLPSDRVVAVTLGIVTPAKRIGKVLEGLALLPRGRRPFLFVGGAVASDDPLKSLVVSLGLQDDVVFSGYLSEEDFWRSAAAADFAVNLRYPTMGETSGAVCRLAGSGLPIVVSDVGWFQELPDAFASKISIGRDEVPAVARALDLLASDEDDRRRRAEAAVKWGRERSPAEVAKRYSEVLYEAAGGRSRAASLVSSVASALAALGAGQPGESLSRDRGPDAALVLAVARAARGVLATRE